MSSYLKLTFVNQFSDFIKNNKNAIHILSLHQQLTMYMKNEDLKKRHSPGSNCSPKSWFCHDWSLTFLETMVVAQWEAGTSHCLLLIAKQLL